MQIMPVKISDNRLLCKNEAPFGHGHHKTDNNYTKKQQMLLIATSTLGVLGSLAILAKRAGYSLNLSTMFKDIKNSYLAKADFQMKEVISMGVGSCAGGLVGGYIVDKNPENRRAKRRETLMQAGNVAIPIFTVDLLVDKLLKTKSEGIRAIAGLAGVAIGVTISNIVMNKLNNWIFHEKRGEGRKVKFTDFSAHLDDVVVAASYISKADIVHAIGRLVPAALVIPGLEVANKTAGNKE